MSVWASFAEISKRLLGCAVEPAPSAEPEVPAVLPCTEEWHAICFRPYWAEIQGFKDEPPVKILITNCPQRRWYGPYCRLDNLTRKEYEELVGKHWYCGLHG